MMRAENFGNKFMKTARSMSESSRGLYQENLDHLVSLGSDLLERIPRIEKLFGITVPLLDDNGLCYPAYLICGSWGCEISSEAFVDCSFLWNWIRGIVSLALEDGDTLGDTLRWLQNPNSVVEYIAKDFSGDYRDTWGHTFFHAAALAGKQFKRYDLFAMSEQTLVTHSGRSELHYAAALGNKGICEALGYLNIELRDKDNHLPVFYAKKNRHTELSDILTAKLQDEDPE